MTDKKSLNVQRFKSSRERKTEKGIRNRAWSVNL
jgi:hypothetical protein